MLSGADFGEPACRRQALLYAIWRTRNCETSPETSGRSWRTTEPSHAICTANRFLIFKYLS
ncbi:hypothetical protein FH5T_21175 [Draconibacterium orientale]|uniref:Uncharacterized protein n=1 Tax=Draconibacterium orientale TaxID=1168034 RepID=A0ABM5QFN1_9BACT|nr:hypothetical protein FH5T_21175 [Draconibacterium orientale]